MRVISLAPTHTETIAALEAMDLLVGVSEDCDFPEKVRRLPTYGSWASPDLQALCRVAPDLLCTFGSHQEEMAEWLRRQGLSVFHSDPATVKEALRAMRQLAECLERPTVGARLVERLADRLQAVEELTARIPDAVRPKIFRIMHWHPLITVGPGAFQYDVIERAGGRNLLGPQAAPYERVAPEQVTAWNPDIIFFCEPSIEPLLLHDAVWAHCSAMRSGHIHVLPCGLTCRAGPRIVDMTVQLAQIVFDWFQHQATRGIAG
ncbi:ABC transporter substrate-binding protein [Desulfosoma sp.]